MKPKLTEESSFSLEKILGVLTAFFYVLFTLAPDSNSLMVLYPFVLLWQIGLFLPVLWLLLLFWSGKVTFLGQGFDWLMSLILIGVVISSVFAEFPHQAVWYGWIALCFVAAVYVLNYYLKNSEIRLKLLIRQGYLSFSFIIISLFLWTTETLFPELNRIAELKKNGVHIGFDFAVVELRNWAPLGHQNYVAGYLLLCLPLFVGLSLIEKGWRRWLWISSLFLGVIDLYTTSSKGGWLALAAILVISLGLLLFYSSLPRLWLIFGGLGGLSLLTVFILSNNRLLKVINQVFQGKGGEELVFRMINGVIGYEMGISHPLTGVGLGGVPLLYQKYRPFWAGEESELVFQLHSTPFQLWAEMGIWGAIYGVLGISCLLAIAFKLLYQSKDLGNSDHVLAWSILAGFSGYGIMSITDYQLDNICISGVLVLFWACLANINVACQNISQSVFSFPLKSRQLSIAGLAVVAAFSVWVIPVHRAWQFSSQGFWALAQDDFKTFQECLDRAIAIAPWESYYPYQLGWNFGDLGRKSRNISEKRNLESIAIKYFQKANTVAPYQEFGHSNLGWLLLNFQPQEATKEFATSAKLLPTKKGVFFGLGLSLLVQQQVDLAVEAFSLEILRDPLFLTSPLWRSPQLQTVYPQVLQNLELTYSDWLEQEPDNITWHRDRGGVYWWEGKIKAAREDWIEYGTVWQKLLLDITSESELKAKIGAMTTSSPKKLLLEAWFNPQQRQNLLQQAWLTQQQSVISPQIEEKLRLSMEQSPNLEVWLKYNAPVFPYSHQRAGFGVISRHIDGVIPVDFYLVVENSAIATWFNDIYPSLRYNPDLDQAIQPRRDKLLADLEI